MKQRDLIYAVGVVLILIGSVAGLGSQSNLWESATIVSDSTAPIINAGASTHGKVATPGDLKPTLLCFITENNELTRVTATIQQWNLLMWTQVDKITLKEKTVTGDLHTYQGKLNTALTSNKEYRIIYKAIDQAGLSDETTQTLELVDIDGTVYVKGTGNWIEVKKPDQIIYVTTNQLHFLVDITGPTDNVEHVQLTLNGEQVELFTSTGAAGSPGGGGEPPMEASVYNADYTATYTLPGDGRYTLTVNILEKGGGEVRLASLTLDLGSGGNPWVLIGAGLAMLVVSAVIFTKQKRRNPQ